jgi:hypothetical protein
VSVNIICWGELRSYRKPPTCQRSLTNFITFGRMLYISTLAAIFCGDMYMKIRLPNNPSYDGPKPHFIHMTVLLRRGPSWSYGSWIPNYKCTYAISDYHHFSWRGVLDTTLCDKDCQWLVAGLWFSPVSLVSSTNKTDHRNIVESGIKHHNPNPFKKIQSHGTIVSSLPLVSLTSTRWISYWSVKWLE